MNPWIVLPGLVLLALLFVLIPVGGAMATRHRRLQSIRCPVIGAGAAVSLRRAGVAEVLGRRSLRRVSRCSLWPRMQGCRQDCRLLSESAFRPAHETR